MTLSPVQMITKTERTQSVEPTATRQFLRASHSSIKGRHRTKLQCVWPIPPHPESDCPTPLRRAGGLTIQHWRGYDLKAQSSPAAMKADDYGGRARVLIVSQPFTSSFLWVADDGYVSKHVVTARQFVKGVDLVRLLRGGAVIL